MNDNNPPLGNQTFSAAVSQDRDDIIAAPATWNGLLERANTRLKTMSSGYKGANQLYFKSKPKPLSPVYKSAVGTGYQVLPRNKPVWIDCTDPTVPHYGTLVGWNNAASLLNIPINCTVITTYFLGLRGLQ